VSSILLRTLFYRGGELIIPPTSRVTGVQMVVDMTDALDDDPVARYLGYYDV
jgi:hypothetical protein